LSLVAVPRVVAVVGLLREHINQFLELSLFKLALVGQVLVAGLTLS
jgi:hypothetical protein